MKTAVTVLQEMMVKLGQTPEYECIAQSGPQHQAVFDYRCVACGVVTTASARSKKEAKQEVARLMLQQLVARGYAVPPPYGMSTSRHVLDDDVTPGDRSGADTRSYVALLKELCSEYRLAAVTYELVGDTGPPHLRHFTVCARLGQHERLATATTKKQARQLAAEKLYSYLRENLARVTKDFDENDALIRAHEKAMERYSESQEDHPHRIDLGQRVADYHIGLTSRIDADTLERALAALEPQESSESESDVLLRVCGALRLGVEAEVLAGEDGAELGVCALRGAAPDLLFAGERACAAPAAALRYLRLVLRHEAPANEDLIP